MDNLIGKTLDGLYTIQELIGAGGMANVYKAVVSAPGGPVPEGTVVAGGTQEESEEMMRIASAGAARMGLEPYYLYRQKNMAGNLENVGYASPGKAGIYNILIMEEKQTIVACGAGTVTKRVYGDGRIDRCDNVKDVKLYMEKIDEMIQRKQQLFSEE